LKENVQERIKSEKGLKSLHCRPVFVFVVFGEDPEIKAQEKERDY